MLLRSGLDVVAGLLCGRPDARGIGWLAVGHGSDDWDDTAPPPDPSRVALSAEAGRVPLRPGTLQLSYDDATGRVVVRATFPSGALPAGASLREVGLFAGRASARPGSGVLVSHRVHPVDVVAAEGAVHRDVALTLPSGMTAALRDLVGALLARRPGWSGLTAVAVGTSAGPDASGLLAERWRGALGPLAVRYLAAQSTVEVHVRVPPGAAYTSSWPLEPPDPDEPERPLRPMPIREVGIVGGPTADGPGHVVVRDVIGDSPEAPAPRPDDARPFRHRVRLVLVGDTDVEVPDLDGLSLDAARERLLPDLLVGRITEKVVVGTSGGTVVAQDPVARTRVHELTPVALTVVRLTHVNVPDVVGLLAGQARAVLRRRGLQVTDEAATQVVGPDGPARNTVVAQDPLAGRRVARDTTITLTVAVPQTLAFPEVRGRTRTSATAELRRAGFGADITWTERESLETPATVVAQEPVQLTPAPLDTPITLTLAVPVTVEVPAVVGDELAAASAEIAAAGDAVTEARGLVGGPAGLSVGSLRAVASAAQAAGTVVDQKPGVGGHAPLFGAVELGVAVGASVPVPRLAGMNEDAASDALGAAGLRVGRISRRASTERVGTVVGQEPAPGTLLPTGLRVDMVLAAAARVAVPPLVRYGLNGATEALSARGLRLGTVRTRVSDGRPGTIIEHSPTSGTLVAAGSAVAVTVVEGIPSVVGLPLAKAAAMLTAAGLTVVEERLEAEPPIGVVVRQDPEAGDPVPANHRVLLWVTVAAQVRVPNVVGSQPSAAVATLVGVGLAGEVAGTEPGPGDAVAEGAVRRQDPAAETPVPAGTTVSLWIRAADRIPVPDVRRKPLVDAARLVEQARLRPIEGASVSSIEIPAGHVATQDPAHGELVPPGTRVVLHPASAAAVEVPDLRGLDPGTAANWLFDAGLTSREEDRYATFLTLDLVRIVAGQSPAPGDYVPAGTEVTLIVGVGLPNLLGHKEADARHLAEWLELRLETVEVYSPRHQAGTVIATDPRPGAAIIPRDRLLVSVAYGKLTVATGTQFGGVGETFVPKWEFPIVLREPEPDPDPFGLRRIP